MWKRLINIETFPHIYWHWIAFDGRDDMAYCILTKSPIPTIYPRGWSLISSISSQNNHESSGGAAQMPSAMWREQVLQEQILGWHDMFRLLLSLCFLPRKLRLNLPAQNLSRTKRYVNDNNCDRKSVMRCRMKSKFTCTTFSQALWKIFCYFAQKNGGKHNIFLSKHWAEIFCLYPKYFDKWNNWGKIPRGRTGENPYQNWLLNFVWILLEIL